MAPGDGEGASEAGRVGLKIVALPRSPDNETLLDELEQVARRVDPARLGGYLEREEYGTRPEYRRRGRGTAGTDRVPVCPDET